jgi:SAM-dependent methyltransferase
MGDKSQPAFLYQSLNATDFCTNNTPKLALNTGSITKNFGSDYSFMNQWNTTIEGCDIEGGPNVKHVFDLTEPAPVHLINRFDLIISSSTLEHVTFPWKAAECLENLLKPNGFIYVSVPWVWRYHKYPNDYWRFNSHSLDLLFRRTVLINQAWSTSPDCVLHSYSDNIDNEYSIKLRSKTNQSLLQRIFSRARLSPSQSGSMKYLPYLMIHQLRRKSL